MKRYLVGGAIRDELLGLPIEEKDWVVVGSDHIEMINLGFKQVGKNFPVYLHPKSKEEYALARKESKIGKGHKEFKFHANKKISLEEDLKRRDLTINAIARDDAGTIYDPYGGLKDLKRKRIQIISKAFFEDPLRLFRVARFKAKLSHLRFGLTKDTLSALKKIVNSNEIEYLSGERIWEETQKSLKHRNSSIYFTTLNKAKALDLFQGLSSSYKKNLRHLKKFDKYEGRAIEKWAILNLNSNSISETETRIRVPNNFIKYRVNLTISGELISKKNRPEQILNSFEKINLFRDKNQFFQNLATLKEIGFLNKKSLKDWTELAKKLCKIKVKVSGLKPKEIGKKLKEDRLKQIIEYKDVI